jgi:2-keto-4-pentenoate hydratase/2-oxohepta-3-ene-1,7-dioic acid hydratase in catechol pathway
VSAVEDEGVPVEGVDLLPPVRRPGKIICIGLNYRSHAEELGREAPETPTFFAKFANALAPPLGTVRLPSYSEKVDYEAEVFDGAAPCGPALVIPDQAGPHDAIQLELRLNGEVMQSGCTGVGWRAADRPRAPRLMRSGPRRGSARRARRAR